MPEVHNFMTKDMLLFINTKTFLSPKNADLFKLKNMNQKASDIKGLAETIQPSKNVWIPKTNKEKTEKNKMEVV